MLADSGLAATYFARTNTTLAKFSRVDETLDFRWSQTPASSLGDDGFSVRWSGQVLAKFSENHTFHATSDGGLRLWVNGYLIIDDWLAHPMGTASASMRLTAGRSYDIRVDYYTDGVDPGIKLEWNSARLLREVVPSNRLFASTLDDFNPTAPSRLRAASANNNSIEIEWDDSTDPSGVLAYDIYVDSRKVTTTSPGERSYLRTNLNAGTGYTFSVQAVDAAGNLSPMATTAITTAAPPSQAPSRPLDVAVTGVTSSTISLAWSASTDDGVLAGYRIYRNGVKIAATSGPNFTDTDLSSSTTYTYTVRSVDNVPLYSGHSDPISGTTAQSAGHSAFSSIAGAGYDAASGVSTSGNDLTNLDAGDWVRYDNVNFGSGANSVKFGLSLPSSNRGGYLELRLGSANGTLIGTHIVQVTGSWNTYIQQQVNISSTIGEHDLYVVFKGRSGVANLRSTIFSSQHLTQIMAVGDSITQQSVAHPSYRYYLWQKLQNAGYPVDFVGSQTQAWNGEPENYNFDQNHEGRSGLRADQIASSIVSWASANVPDVVLLHAGTNDLEQFQGVNSTVSDIGEIITGLRQVNPNVRILLALIIPQTGLETTIAELNSALPGMAESMTTARSPITIVDLNTNFPANGLDTDQIHPNNTGDSFMANQWYSALTQILQ